MLTLEIGMMSINHSIEMLYKYHVGELEEIKNSALNSEMGDQLYVLKLNSDFEWQTKCM